VGSALFDKDPQRQSRSNHARVLEGVKKRGYPRSSLLKTIALKGKMTFGDPLLRPWRGKESDLNLGRAASRIDLVISISSFLAPPERPFMSAPLLATKNRHQSNAKVVKRLAKNKTSRHIIRQTKSVRCWKKTVRREKIRPGTRYFTKAFGRIGSRMLTEA
jgi:hypothetical protein